MFLQFTTTRRYSSMMLLDLHDIKRMKIVQIKKTINWIYLCKQISVQIVMEILLILVRSRMIIAIKHRKILLFLLLIVSLTQHNDLCLHLDTRSQNNKTQPIMSDFWFSLRERHLLFSLFINRISLKPNSNEIFYELNLYINTSIRVIKF